MLSRFHIKTLFMLTLIPLLSFCNYKFIRLRIYPPTESKTFVNENRFLGFEIVDELNLDDQLAIHNPYYFNRRILKNEYGSLKNILEREIQNHPMKYERVLSSGKTQIRILDYNLGTRDSCWQNTTYVEFKAEILYAQSKENFYYKDSIHSSVTDCFLIGSSITVVPLLFYIPYQGFRGNREDQINQLGRNSIEALLFFLQGKKYKPHYLKYNAQNSNSAKEEFLNPKNKETISSMDEQ